MRFVWLPSLPCLSPPHLLVGLFSLDTLDKPSTLWYLPVAFDIMTPLFLKHTPLLDSVKPHFPCFLAHFLTVFSNCTSNHLLYSLSWEQPHTSILAFLFSWFSLLLSLFLILKFFAFLLWLCDTVLSESFFVYSFSKTHLPITNFPPDSCQCFFSSQLFSSCKLFHTSCGFKYHLYVNDASLDYLNITFSMSPLWNFF